MGREQGESKREKGVGGSGKEIKCAEGKSFSAIYGFWILYQWESHYGILNKPTAQSSEFSWKKKSCPLLIHLESYLISYNVAFKNAGQSFLFIPIT